MKKILVIIMLLMLFNIYSVSAKERVNLYLFHGRECPHCNEEIKYLNKIAKKYKNVNIKYYEVWHNKNNNELMNSVKNSFDINSKGVPLTIIGHYKFLGFSENTKKQIKQAIEDCSYDKCIDAVKVNKKINIKKYLKVKNQVIENRIKREKYIEKSKNLTSLCISFVLFINLIILYKYIYD